MNSENTANYQSVGVSFKYINENILFFTKALQACQRMKLLPEGNRAHYHPADLQGAR